MYVSIQELVKGDVITDFKWEVKEDMNADLSGELMCALRWENSKRKRSTWIIWSGGNLSILQRKFIYRI